jgi:hypothetical protein
MVHMSDEWWMTTVLMLSIAIFGFAAGWSAL